jgi:hypothetical protein
VTGCGCAILVALLLGGLFFMIFGSTDSGEPIAQIAALAVIAAIVLRYALTGGRRALQLVSRS